MQTIKIRIVGADEKPAWPDLDGVKCSDIEEVVVVEEGTASGNPTVGFRILTPRGETVIIQLTGRLMDGIQGAYTGVLARKQGEVH